MQVNLNLNLIDILAVWGAFVASLVLLWDVYKWRTSGPRTSFTVSPDKMIIGHPLFPEDKTYISAKAINTGDRPTTITNLGFQWYKSRFHKLCRKPCVSAIVGNPNPGLPLPYVLQPGTTWDGLADQDEVIEKRPKKGMLVCELYLSHRQKPKTVSVTIKNKKT